MKFQKILVGFLVLVATPLLAFLTPPISHFAAIIFDCDGVLVDTEYLKYLSWKKALEPYHITFTLAEYMPLVGNSGEFILERILMSKKMDVPKSIILQKKREIYEILQKENIPAIDPAVAFAKRLALEKSRLNIKLALASSASHDEIMRNLKAVGLENAFDVIISGNDDLKDIVDKEGTNKPKPYIYQRVAEWLNVKPEDCVVFEDTEAGVMAAAKTGMSVFAVPNRFTQHQDFSHATRILNNLTELNIE